MTPPDVACARFLCCAGIGLLLGPGVDLIRPLHRRFHTLFQIIVSVMLFAGWLFCSFAVCRGDIRIGYLSGIPAGYFLWFFTLHLPFCRITDRFWWAVGRIFRLILRPVHTFFKKILKIEKFFFASWKKWFTIG